MKIYFGLTDNGACSYYKNMSVKETVVYCTSRMTHTCATCTKRTVFVINIAIYIYCHRIHG
jgi:hypothetical protein